MFSKNNVKLRMEKNAVRKNRYKIRKLSIGVASFIAGALLAFGGSNDAQAADTAESAVVATANTETTAKEETSTKLEDTATAENASVNSVELTTNNTVSATAVAEETAKEEVSPRAATNVNVSDIIDDTTQSNNVTLVHGDNATRNVSVILPANAGDVITVDVPHIFNATSDKNVDVNISTSVEAVADPGYITNKAHQNTTFTYQFNSTASVLFNIKLTPNVSDWSFLEEGSEYKVTLKKNGEKLKDITYTIAKPAEIENVNISFDQNQTASTGLVKGHKYSVGIHLDNDGAYRDGDHFEGTVTLDVPKGFVVDTTSYGHPYGLTNTKVVGDTDSTFNTLSKPQTEVSPGVPNPKEYVNISQNGGAGTPVTITFNRSKDNLEEGSLLLFGTYTEDISAAENNFSATVNYHSINIVTDEKAKNQNQQASGSKNVGIAVTNNEKNSLKVDFKNNDKDQKDIYTDNGQVNGEHQTNDTKYNYDAGRSIEVYNDGNTAQTNVNIHIDVEPGTVLNYDSKGDVYALAVTTSSENQPDGIVKVTLTDGTSFNLKNGNGPTPSNMNSKVIAIHEEDIQKGLARDGSNIKSIDIGYKNIEAGTKVKISFGQNAIITENSAKKAGDVANYAFNVTSDQANESGSMTLDIKDPSVIDNQFTGKIESFNNTSYQIDSTSGGNEANIRYVIRNIVQLNDRPSTYLLAIPQGFDVEDASQLTAYKASKEYSDAKIEDLGYVGLNGERMFKVSLPNTPDWRSANAVTIGGVNSAPIKIVADKNQLPISYSYYTDNGMSLFMEVNDDNILVKPTNNARTIEEITLKDGTTYKVRSSNLGFYPGFVEAKYSFTSLSTYGSLNGVKNESAGKYAGETDIVKFNYMKDMKDGELPNTKGSIRLANILTDKGTSAYSYNVVNLPSVANGDDVTLTLTGNGNYPVSTTGDSGNGTVLYSYEEFSGEQVTDEVVAKYVTADQVTDWSKVRSVLLKSENLSPSATASVELPFVVSDMKEGVKNTSIKLDTHFTGEHSSATSSADGIYNAKPTFNLEIQRYVRVTTNWVDTDDNVLQTPKVEVVEAGDTYTTSGITVDKYTFKEIKDGVKPAGVTEASDVTVTYVYEAEKEREEEKVTFKQTIKYIYAETKEEAKPTKETTVTFTRQKITNKATGIVTYTEWSNDGTYTFVEVKSPDIEGYTPNIPVVAKKVVNATDELKEFETIVEYSKNAVEKIGESGPELSYDLPPLKIGVTGPELNYDLPKLDLPNPVKPDGDKDKPDKPNENNDKPGNDNEVPNNDGNTGTQVNNKTLTNTGDTTGSATALALLALAGAAGLRSKKRKNN